MTPSPEAVLRESFGRREFLRRGAGGLLLALGGVLPGCGRPSGGRDDNRVLSDSERQVLQAIGERFLPGGGRAPAASEIDVAGKIERLLPELGPHAISDFRHLLALFEWSPLLFECKLRRFTTLPPEVQDQVIRGWAVSRLGLRRSGFAAMKRLAMSVYYAQEESWPAIGFPGPWLQS